MRRFFLPTSQIHETRAVISGSELHHLRHVLRLQPGALVAICDEHGNEYQGVITLLSSTRAEISITRTLAPLSRFSLTLVQGILKGQKMDFVIEKATELGVRQIIPVVSQFTVARFSANRQDNRLIRWQRIAQSAAKQSGSPVPQLSPPRSLREFLQSFSDNSEKILFYEKAQGETLKTFAQMHPTLSSLCVIVGTEGGFAKEEVEQARQVGCHILSFGPQVLRAETASIVAVALSQFFWRMPELPPLPER
jgi:16S rRNA (uracil1498-N3)-methyltransferase